MHPMCRRGLSERKRDEQGGSGSPGALQVDVAAERVHSVPGGRAGRCPQQLERGELGARVEYVGRIVGLDDGERTFPVESADELVKCNPCRRLPLEEEFQSPLRGVFVFLRRPMSVTPKRLKPVVAEGVYELGGSTSSQPPRISPIIGEKPRTLHRRRPRSTAES
jgi:hypothetical protein